MTATRTRCVERRAGGSVVLWERPGLGVMATPSAGCLILCLADGPHPFDAVAVTIAGEQLEELAAIVPQVQAAGAAGRAPVRVDPVQDRTSKLVLEDGDRPAPERDTDSWRSR